MIRAGGGRTLRSEVETANALIRIAHPLRDAGDLDPLMDHIADARYVLLGEASHGTHDYYAWRALISQRLILGKGFCFIDETTALHPLHIEPVAGREPPETYPWGI